MAEYSVKVNSSNFLDISTGQQKFLILSYKRDPIVGDILVITNRNSHDQSVKAVITSFEIETNGIEPGFVIVSIDLDVSSKNEVKSKAEINIKIGKLENEISTLKEQKTKAEAEQRRLLNAIAIFEKEQGVIGKPNEINNKNYDELAEKYNSICERYNELDTSKTDLRNQYNGLSKEIDSLHNEISKLKAENSSQKNELSRRHNAIEGFKFELNKANEEKAKLYKRNDDLANSNSSLTEELHKQANSETNKDRILTPAPNEYMQLKTLTKNLLSYIDSNL